MSNQKTSPVESKAKGEYTPADGNMPATTFAFAFPTPQQRDARLNLPPSGNPLDINAAVLFFIEVRSLMTGFRDEVAAEGLKNNEPVLKRNWCYPGLDLFGPAVLCPTSNFIDPIT